MRVPGGFHIDDPAFPLLQAHISYWNSTSGAGNAAGTTLVCADLANEPSYQGMAVKLLDGDAAGQVRDITVHIAGTGILIFPAFTDNAGAVVQVVAGTQFVVMSAGGGGGDYEVLGSGTLDTSSTTVPADSARAALYVWEDDDWFNGCSLMTIEGDARFSPRPIVDYDDGTGVFTLDPGNPFPAAPGAVDYVILRGQFPMVAVADSAANRTPYDGIGSKADVLNDTAAQASIFGLLRFILTSGNGVEAIFALTNAILTLMETGGTLTTDGNEQDVWRIETPVGVFAPKSIQIDLTNSQAGETVVIRTYYRLRAGGNLIKQTEVEYAGVQDPECIPTALQENRFGIQVTLERTAGVARDYDWSVTFEG